MTNIEASDPATPEPTPHRSRRKRWILVIAAAAGTAVLAVSVFVARQAADHNQGASTASSPLIGRSAPPLAGETVTGGHVSLGQFGGRWVVVNFFASWCVPCQQETPELAGFANAHRGANDPAVLGVVYQDDDTSVRSFVAARHVTWPLLAFRSMGPITNYGVAGIPVTFLVGPDGRVATKAIGGLHPGQLDTLLAAAQAGPSTQPAATAP